MSSNSSNVKIYADVDLQTASVNLADSTIVPENPRPGNMCTINGVIHFYTSIEGSDPFWMPIAQSKSSHVHTQVEPNDTWTISHNLGTNDLLVQVYDDANDLVYAKPIFLNVDQIQIKFTEPTAGRAIVFGVSAKFAGFNPDAESLTSDTVVYGTTVPGEFDSGSIYFQV